MRRTVVGFVAFVVLMLAAPAFAAPVNDDRANAAPLAFPQTVTGDTTAATREAAEPRCSATDSGTVWYRFTTATRTHITLDTAGSTYDTTLAVYTPGSDGFLYTSACNDDAAPGVLTSRVVFETYADDVYLVQIGGYGAARGAFVLNSSARLPGPPPPNDTRETAAGITLPYVAALDMSDASGEQPYGCDSYGPSVWYSIRPGDATAVRARIQAPQGGFAAVSAWVPGEARPRACARSWVGSDAITWRADADTEYLIQVSGASWSSDSIVSIAIEEAPSVDLAVTGIAVRADDLDTGLVRHVDVTLANLRGGDTAGWLTIKACPQTAGGCTTIADDDVRVDATPRTLTFTWDGEGVGAFTVTANIEAFDVTDLDPDNDTRSRSSYLVTDATDAGVGVGCIYLIFVPRCS